jgi:hypothetical protein
VKWPEWRANGDAAGGEAVDGPEHIGRILNTWVRHMNATSMNGMLMRRGEPAEPVTSPAEVPEEDQAAEAGVEVPEGFHVDDEPKASWAVRKIVEVRAHAERVKRWAERELHRSQRDEAWLMRRFGPELEAWLREELRRRGGRRRSIALPDGTLGLRQQPPKLEVVEEPVVAAWCERHLPEAVRVCVESEGAAALELARWQRRHEEDARLRRQVLREPLARHAAESGELPEGCSLRPAEDRFYVK